MEMLVAEKHDQGVADLYDQNKKWLSEISFIEDEMNYVKSLMEKYFSLMLADQYVNRAQLIYMQLDVVCKKKYAIKEAIKLHESNLESNILNIKARSYDFLALENEKINAALNELRSNFKTIKAEVFLLTN